MGKKDRMWISKESRKIFAALLLLLPFISISAAPVRDTIFVNWQAGGDATGENWANADTSLNSALVRVQNSASEEVYVCIAEGEYVPSGSSFEIKPNYNLPKQTVRLLGGFKNVQSNSEQERNTDQYRTVFTSNGATLEYPVFITFWSRDDFAYEVNGIRFENILGNYIIHANNHFLDIVDCVFENINTLSDFGTVYFENTFKGVVKGCTFSNNESIGQGGAIRFYGTQLTVSGCDFTNCKSESGGALSISTLSATIDNCFFESCSSSHTSASSNIELYKGGGAVFAEGNLIDISNSDFLYNQSNTNGGALFVRAKETRFLDNKFDNNYSGHYGGALFNLTLYTFWANDTFTNNSSRMGGAAVVGSGGVVKNCIFEKNSADSLGGAAFGSGQSDSNLVVTSSLFSENTSLKGGAWACDKEKTVFGTGTKFIGNSADSTGGAVFICTDGKALFSFCQFESNYAPYGGAISSVYGWNYYEVQNSTFLRNSAQKGGVVYSSLQDTSVYNRCHFYYNQADSGSVSYKWNGKLQNCLLFANHADSAYTIVGTEFGPYSGPAITNSTVISNTAANSQSAGLYGCQQLIENSILWDNNGELTDCSLPRYSIIQNWAGGGIGNYKYDPRFLSPSDTNFSLSVLSPARNTGNPESDIEEIGNKDLAGNPRLFAGRIDIGAFEYQDTGGIRLPCILSTLSSFEIPAADSLKINLAKRAEDGSGYYVSCTNVDPSRLVWFVSDASEKVKTRIDVQSGLLTVIPDVSLLPGNSFIMKFTVSDPEYPDLASEKYVTFRIVEPGFNVCSSAIVQNPEGRDFTGNIQVSRNVHPISLNQGRIYLNDGIVSKADFTKMPYIKDIQISEAVKSRSRGGTAECGSYTFAFNATSADVYFPSGNPSGRTLLEWVTDSTSSGNLNYAKSKSITFIVPISDGYQTTKLLLSASADFDAPLTSEFKIVRNDSTSQTLRWGSFNKELESLSLIILPQGEDAPEERIYHFPDNALSSLSFTADSLQDSRTYRYLLEATDLRGNIGISEITGTTESGMYTVSGEINGVYLPHNDSSEIRVQL